MIGDSSRSFREAVPYYEPLSDLQADGTFAKHLLKLRRGREAPQFIEVVDRISRPRTEDWAPGLCFRAAVRPIFSAFRDCSNSARRGIAAVSYLPFPCHEVSGHHVVIALLLALAEHPEFHLSTTPLKHAGP